MSASPSMLPDLLNLVTELVTGPPWPRSSSAPSPSQADAQEAVRQSREPKDPFSCARLADRVWSLRHNLGTYDACFVALAESLEVGADHLDGKQAAASGHYACLSRWLTSSAPIASLSHSSLPQYRDADRAIVSIQTVDFRPILGINSHER